MNSTDQLADHRLASRHRGLLRRFASAGWTCLAVTALCLTQTICVAQDAPADPAPALPAQPAFPDLSIPASADAEALQALIEKAKAARPRTPNQYQAMQTTIRDASKQLMAKLQKDSPEYRQAELAGISAAVALMAFFGEDAKKKTLEQVQDFLKGRETLSLTDLNTGIMAAAMLEMQPQKAPARDLYQLMVDLLKEDEREEMQSLRLNLQAAVRRLELLGNKMEFTAESIDGKQLNIDDFDGKYVIVDFFATWCEPCLEEVPRLIKHYEKYHAKGLEVIGVSLDNDEKRLAAYLADKKLPWNIVHDNHEDPLDRLAMQFGVAQLPTVFLVNKKGIVVSLEARGAELDRLVQMLFETPTPAAPQPAAPQPGVEQEVEKGAEQSDAAAAQKPGKATAPKND